MAHTDRPQNGVDFGHDVGLRTRERRGIDDQALAAQIHGPNQIALPWTLMGPGIRVGPPTPELAPGRSRQNDVVGHG